MSDPAAGEAATVCAEDEAALLAITALLADRCAGCTSRAAIGCLEAAGAELWLSRRAAAPYAAAGVAVPIVAMTGCPGRTVAIAAPPGHVLDANCGLPPTAVAVTTPAIAARVAPAVPFGTTVAAMAGCTATTPLVLPV